MGSIGADWTLYLLWGISIAHWADWAIKIAICLSAVRSGCENIRVGDFLYLAPCRRFYRTLIFLKCPTVSELQGCSEGKYLRRNIAASVNGGRRPRNPFLPQQNRKPVAQPWPPCYPNQVDSFPLFPPSPRPPPRDNCFWASP